MTRMIYSMFGMLEVKGVVIEVLVFDREIFVCVVFKVYI